jgi:hypothetical protein
MKETSWENEKKRKEITQSRRKKNLESNREEKITHFSKFVTMEKCEKSLREQLPWNR